MGKIWYTCQPRGLIGRLRNKFRLGMGLKSAVNRGILMSFLYNPSDRIHVICRHLVYIAFRQGQILIPVETPEHLELLSKSIGRVISNWRSAAQYGNTLGEPSLSAMAFHTQVIMRKDKGHLEISRRGYGAAYRELFKNMPEELKESINRMESQATAESIESIEDRLYRISGTNPPKLLHTDLSDPEFSWDDAIAASLHEFDSEDG